MLAPAGDVYQAGTLSGNPLAVAAGLATLELLDEAAYARLAAITERLADGLREAAGRRHPVQVVSAPGLLTVFFSERAGARLRGRAGAATSRPTRAGAASCSRAASTRRRRSSRPGSRRWRTRAEQIERTLEAAAAAFAALPDGRRARDERGRATLGDRTRSSACARCCASEGGLIATLRRRRRRAARAAARAPGEARRSSPRAGPRADGRREEYELLVEAIYEGYLLHYGEPRVRARAGGRPARCWPATACTRSGWRGWSSSATPRRSPSWPTRSR